MKEFCQYYNYSYTLDMVLDGKKMRLAFWPPEEYLYVEKGYLYKLTAVTATDIENYGNILGYRKTPYIPTLSEYNSREWYEVVS